MSTEYETSDLTKIDEITDDPFDLFQRWLQNVRDSGVPIPDMFNFATSDGCGRISARNLILRQLESDGFVFMTDGRSKKSFDLAKCPQAAMTFMWVVPEPSQVLQVRIEGQVRRENFKEYQHIYMDEPLYCKVRSMFCRQGEHVEWSEHKKLHDEMYEEVKQNSSWKQLEPPPHYIIYKMYPEMFEFFAANDESTADRVIFRRPNDACIPLQVLETFDKMKEIMNHDCKNGSQAHTKNGQDIDTQEKGSQNDKSKVKQENSSKNGEIKKIGTKIGYQMHVTKKCTKNNDECSGNGKESKSDHNNYFDVEDFKSTFNNSLKIQVGIESKIPKSKEENWIYYRIAA